VIVVLVRVGIGGFIKSGHGCAAASAQSYSGSFEVGNLGSLGDGGKRPLTGTLISQITKGVDL